MFCVVVTAPGRAPVGNLAERLRGHQGCWVADTNGSGQARNYWRALRTALDICERYDLRQILVCEDDVELCAWALEYIDTVDVPDDLAWLQWFEGRARSHEFAPHQLPLIWPCYAPPWLQAITWPVRSLRQLLSEPLPSWWTFPHGGDDLLMCVSGDLRWQWGAHVPHLVQHVGAVSLVDPTRSLANRTSSNYPGVDFDARTLWSRERRSRHG